MKLIESINRLAIYFFYDADGIVDRYVPYMLNDLKKNCSDILVVCNGKLTSEGRKTFLSITPHLLVRENKGFDVWAYKTALEYYGWKKLSEYDEVVLMNFTLFGPLYPLSEMFEEMNQRDIDFWGVTKHHGFPFDPFGTIPCGYIPEHIQSSFICVRSSMLNSPEFHIYWETMDQVTSYAEAVGKHEAIFTQKFEDAGFQSAVYVQTDDLKEYTHYPLMLMPLELIKNRKCPVFKRKSFTNEYYEFLNASLGEPTIEMFGYIQNHMDYDLDMVWENLLRTDTMADIKNRMHLNYIFPKDRIQNSNSTAKLKTALVMHIYFEDQVESCLRYASSMPIDSDIYFTVCKRETRQALEQAMSILSPRKIQVIEIPNRGRDVSALLVGAAPFVYNYDLICFAHDKKTKQVKPYSVGMSFAYKCLENTLGSVEYVKNIIDVFEQEARLGMLMPPPPNHASYYGVIGTEWASNFENTKKLAKDLGLHVKIQIDKEPITPLGTMFWFRPKCLSALYEKNFHYDSFPEEPNQYDGTLLHAIERIYGFCAQNEGYYTGWCMNDQFAAIEMTNYHFMLRELSTALYSRIGFEENFSMMVHKIRNGKYISSRKIVKESIKRRIPTPIWSLCKKTYHLFGGKKWVG